MADPLISAIICTHNREQYLGAAIDSLLNQTLSGQTLSGQMPDAQTSDAQTSDAQMPAGYEVIVVDNASTDSTAQIARAHLAKFSDSSQSTYIQATYIYEPTLGLSVARNTGAAAAKGQILAYLDDDAEASTEWLTELVKIFEGNEKVAIAGGKVTLIWPPNTQPPSWLSKDLSSALGAYDLGDMPVSIQQPALTPRGLNYAVRKHFLQSVGGFDTHLGRVGTNLLSNEEQQMTRMALDRGWQVMYVPTALAAHNVSPARMKPGWFLRRSWWQGISESYREQASSTTGLWQLRSGGERLVRGVYKTIKYCHRPDQRFENLAYAYGQIAYLGSVIGSLTGASTQCPTPPSSPMTITPGSIPISVLIPAKNEEENLPACLASLVQADEVFVVDSQSEDQSVAIAESLGAKVVQFEFNGRWPKKKNWSLDTLPFRNEWVLIVDCDERITPESWAEIAERIKNPDLDGYYINRRVFFLGKWIRHGGKYPDWNLRLFRHAKGRYENLNTEDIRNTGDNEVHEHVMIPHEKVGYLKEDMLHEDFRDLYHWLARHNRYSNWEARVYYNLLTGMGDDGTIGANLFGDAVQRKRFLKKIWVRLPFKPFLRFVLFYILRLGFLDGYAGYVYGRLLSQYEYQIGVKLYELKFGGRLNIQSKPPESLPTQARPAEANLS